MKSLFRRSLMQRSHILSKTYEKEKLIPMLEISGTGAATEERIVAIEKKVRDIEALVKGLTQELLDLKSVAMKMSKQTEERSRQELSGDQRLYRVHNRSLPHQQVLRELQARSSCAKVHVPLMPLQRHLNHPWT